MVCIIAPMSDRTLFRLAFAVLLGLTACDVPQSESAVAAPTDMAGWRLVSGKTPTKAEFTALAATCQDKGGALDPCLATLGLKRQ